LVIKSSAVLFDAEYHSCIYAVWAGRLWVKGAFTITVDPFLASSRMSFPCSTPISMDGIVIFLDVPSSLMIMFLMFWTVWSATISIVAPAS